MIIISYLPNNDRLSCKWKRPKEIDSNSFLKNRSNKIKPTLTLYSLFQSHLLKLFHSLTVFIIRSNLIKSGHQLRPLTWRWLWSTPQSLILKVFSRLIWIYLRIACFKQHIRECLILWCCCPGSVCWRGFWHWSLWGWSHVRCLTIVRT